MIYLFLLLMMIADAGWAEENGRPLYQSRLRRGGAGVWDSGRSKEAWGAIERSFSGDFVNLAGQVCCIPRNICVADHWPLLQRIVAKGENVCGQREQPLNLSCLAYEALIRLLEYLDDLFWLNDSQREIINFSWVKSQIGLSNVLGMQASQLNTRRSLLKKQNVENVDQQIDELNSRVFSLRRNAFDEAYHCNFYDLMGTCFLALSKCWCWEKSHSLSGGQSRLDSMNKTLDECSTKLTARCFQFDTRDSQHILREEDRQLILSLHRKDSVKSEAETSQEAQ